MNNVYYVGSGELTFDLIERIINENLKLELGGAALAGPGVYAPAGELK